MSSKFYSVRETAEILGISYQTIFRKTSQKEIPSIRLGRKILIPIEFIDGLLTTAMKTAEPQGAA